MADYASLQVKLDMQTAAFERGMHKASQQIKKMDKNTKTMTRSTRGAQKSMASFVKGAVALVGLNFGVSFVKGIIEMNSALAKSADTVGLTVVKFQEYQYAAQLAGVSASQFNSNMIAFVKRVGEASAGMGPLVSGLKKLKPALLESIQASKSQDEAFRLIANAIMMEEDAITRAAIANAAFSRSGVPMVKMLEDGAKGLDKQARAAHALGIIMEEELVRAAEEYDDKMLQIQKQMATTFGTGILKSIGWFLDNAKKYFYTFFGYVEVGFGMLKLTIRTIFLSLVAVVTDTIAAMMGPIRELLIFAGKYNETAKDMAAQIPVFGEASKKAGEQIKKETLELIAKADAIEADALAYNALIDQQNAAAESARKLAREMRAAAAGGGDSGFEKTVDELQLIVVTAKDAGDSVEDIRNKILALYGSGTEQVQKYNALMSDLSIAGNSFIESFSSGLASSLIEGGKNFGDFAKDILKQLAEMILKAVLFNSIMGGLKGTAFGDFLGVGTQALTPVPGGITPFGPTGAPRATVGVLQAPTYGYGGGGGMGGTMVNITNNAPVEVQATERRTSRGIEIDVLIEQQINKSIVGGGLDKSMSSAFGIRRMAF